MIKLRSSLLVAFLFHHISVAQSFEDATQAPQKLHQVTIGGTSLMIGPLLSESGRITLFTLDSSGVFHRCTPPSTPQSGEVVYSVLKNGILVPAPGPYAVTYKINKNGDLIPTSSNSCIYKSDKAMFYLKGIKKMLIPIDVFYSGDQTYYVYDGNRLLFSEPVNKSIKNINLPGFTNPAMSLKLKPEGSLVVPDKSCAGDVVLFLLKSDGEFARNPPDQYLPKGMQLKYVLKDDGSLAPKPASKNPQALQMTYITGENGNLKPSPSNSHTLTTTRETTKSYILSEGGVLAPVSEIMGLNRTISYYYDGRLIHSSSQFRQMYSNSSIVYLKERNLDSSLETGVEPLKPGPKFVCRPKKISKREALYKESGEPLPRQPCAKPDCAFAYDDNGKRISIEPLVNECGKVALYKLTCKGHFKRMEPYKEPESGFEVFFKLLDSCILVPTFKNKGKFCLKYILQENGNLAPVRNQPNSFKKAPASLLYYILAKGKQLIPVRLHILKTNHIDIFYQDCLIHTLAPEYAKQLECFTTLYAPLYCYINGRINIIYADPIPERPCSGATWHNPNKSGESVEFPCKNLYLVGPNGTKIRIEPELNHNNVPVVFEMDCNGICHKSPKDDNKSLTLKSFKLLNKGILMTSDEKNGYIFLVDKQGNMLPYWYPGSKLQAPHGLTVKYLSCSKGVLLPVLVEALVNHIRFSYENTAVYVKKTYTLSENLELGPDKLPNKQEETYYKEKDGSCVYFERIGDCFHRHPCHKTADYLLHHSSYLKRLPCGTLIPLTYPDPLCDVIKVQLQANGDMDIICHSGKKPTEKDYLLTKNGSLVPVEVKKKDGYCKCYREGTRICKLKMDTWTVGANESPTPSGKDPLGIFKDPPPEKEETKEPHYVPIPICTTTTPKSHWDKEDDLKCDEMRKALKDLMAKKPGLINTELQMSDPVLREIYDLVCSCSKSKHRRDLITRIQRHLQPLHHGLPPSPSIEDKDDC